MSESVTVNVPFPEPTGEETPANQQQQAPQSQGDLLAGKFKNVDELVKGYQELSKKLGSRPEEQPQQQQQAPKANLSTTLTTPSTPEAELDLTPYQNEWEQSGKLSDASYQKLAKEHKISRGMVDEFIAHRVEKVQQFHNEVYTSVGGQERFGQMLQWAKGNLSAQDQAAYDKALASNDPGVIRLAVSAVNAKFSEAYGKDPQLIGGRAGSSGVVPFRSQEEMIEAMSDRRYDRDPAYRADVEKRVFASKI